MDNFPNAKDGCTNQQPNHYPTNIHPETLPPTKRFILVLSHSKCVRQRVCFGNVDGVVDYAVTPTILESGVPSLHVDCVAVLPDADAIVLQRLNVN